MYLPRLYLFALLCIPFYIGPELAANVQLNVERLTLALMAAAVLTGVYGKVIRPAISQLWRTSPVFLLSFIGFFLWRALAAFMSPYTVSQYLVINEVASNAFVFILFFWLYFQNGTIQPVLRILTFSVFWMAAVVAIELATQSNPFTPFASASAGDAILNASIERGGMLRSKGAFEHPLTLGQYVVFLLPIVLFMDRAQLPLRRAFLVAVLLIGIGIATGSRATLLILTAQILIYLLFWGLRVGISGRQVNLGVFLWILVPVAAVFVAALAERITGNELFSSYTRVAQIVNGLIAAGNAPWFGFGQGPGGTQAIADAVTYASGSLILWEANLNTIDNWFLSILLGSGLPAVILFLMFNLVVLLSGMRCILHGPTRRAIRQRGELGQFIGVFIAFGGSLGFMGILSIFTLHPLHFILLAWLLALCARYRRVAPEARHQTQPQRRRLATGATK
ncbi:O-antigen ligase family protein [Pontivivens nitratireducens]|uniref:O-antigen ligase family protein n=1 Tax=Pontivivens nitratireducens TaxID=2758038 RepID=UPI00163AF41C|nr:O-antigen ligase family protein [Pontibrevibacter nitratireducens]